MEWNTSPLAPSSLELEAFQDLKNDNDEVASLVQSQYSLKGDVNPDEIGYLMTQFLLLDTETEPKKEIVAEFLQIDEPVLNFQNRDELLSQLHTRLQECSRKPALEERIVVLQGPPLAGKSELARMYTELHLNDPIIENVAWIDCSTEKTVEDTFVSLAVKLQIHINNENPKNQEIYSRIYEHFSDHVGTGLFIFDNVVCASEGGGFRIHEFLPRKDLQCLPLILLTTRSDHGQIWEGILQENVIPVDPL